MIDIIIPAYNAHEYINNALISIAMQTIKEKVNVYIINDGSKYDYSKNVELFKNKISLKELKLEKNSGPGVARQYGIDNSNNEYIMFLDSDDVLYNIFSLEKLYNAIASDDFSLVIGGILDEQGKDLYYYTNHLGCLHGKLYSRNHLNKYNIRFNNTRSSEDNSFNRLVIMSQPKTIYLHEAVYLYTYNTNSITNTALDLDLIKCYISNVIWVVEESTKRNFNNSLLAEYIFSSLIYVYNVYVNNINNNSINILLEYANKLVEINNKYEHYLNDEIKLKIYNSYEYYLIPEISLKDFCQLCIND